MVQCLIIAGKKCASTETQQEYLHDMLEKRLWDDPNKVGD